MSASLLTAVLGALALGAGLVSPDPSARIEVTRGASYDASVVVEGAVGTSGTYAFSVVRQGQGGRSRSQQSGAFELTASTDTLSTSRVNASPGDTIEMELTVTWADGTTDTDTFSEIVE